MSAWQPENEMAESTATHSESRVVSPDPESANLSEWLLGIGPEINATPEVLSRLAIQMIERGIPVSQLRVEIPSPHPLVKGTQYTWSRAPGVTVTEPLEGERALESDGVDADIVVPLRWQNGADGYFTLGTDRPDGLLDSEITEISEMTSILALLLENHCTRHTAKMLLETYIGRHTGRRVLSGEIERGAGELIHAVIWFCDLRDSTRLAETLPLDAFLGVLNDFFDCMAGAVLDHGGEVLRFIGDAALAIFPIGGTSKLLVEACTPSEGACRRALDAARDARLRMKILNEERKATGDPPLGYGLALHVGDVMYGNIGVPQRLEFTVIGRAANEAARLESMCKELGESILISAVFPRCFPRETRSLGTHSLRGVSEPHEIFALKD